MKNYLRPCKLFDALQALGSAAESYTVLAGGTDFYPARVGKPLSEPVLDIGGLSVLRTIEEAGTHYRIGALTTWSDMVHAPLPAWFDGLKQAAREVGGRQVQNAGTVCGNLCNASPAADGVPCLLVLDSQVELRSLNGARRLPLAEFITGNRRTARRADELVTAVLIPKPDAQARSVFLKLGARHYLVISIVMVAALLSVDSEGRVNDARIGVGACSAVAQRLAALEAALLGQVLSPGLAERVQAEHFSVLAPVDDIRASAAYRLAAARILVRRALAQLIGVLA